MKQNKEKIDTKKIVFEIIIIPLAIMYLYYTILYNHHKISLVLLYITSLITCIEFIIKYIREVYVYKSKYNFLKVACTIMSFLILMFLILNLFLKYEIIKKILIILLIIMLCHLFIFAINSIIKIIKGTDKLYKNVVSSFFSLIAFTVIFMGIIIYL